MTQGKKNKRPRVLLVVEITICELRSIGRDNKRIAAQLRIGLSSAKRVGDEQKKT